MKRLRRRLFNALAGISLFLLIASLALHIRSIWRFEYSEWVHITKEPNRAIKTSLTLKSGRGGFSFYIRRDVASDPETMNDLLDPQYFHWHTASIGSFSQSQSIAEIDKTITLHAYWLSYLNPFLPTRFGMQAATRSGGSGNNFWQDAQLAIPYWLSNGLFAVLPTIWLLSWIQARRRRRNLLLGRCPTCGYDLRATPDRCPECGTVPTKAA